jgi:copper chaperone CopZ
LVTGSILYFVVDSAGAVTAVESVDAVAESALTTVESVVSVAVDPEPHAANVNVTQTANKNVIFLI